MFELGCRDWRFIPTGVGNILEFIPADVDYAVHPHGCGEHYMSFRQTLALFGSSPRVWGT